MDREDDSLTGLRFGPYELLDKLADGGSAVIYRAHHAGLADLVAVKVLRACCLDDREALARFRREPKIHARVADHPNVVRIFDAGEAADRDGRQRPFIAMELLSGTTLANRLAGEGPFSEERAIEIAATIVSALKHLHCQGLVHRDLKPSNIFLCNDGRVKVLDWGVARDITQAFTTENAILGTAGYLAPEQANGHPVEAACDIFQFGLVLCEAVTGRPVFDNPSREPVSAAIRRALQRPHLKSRHQLRDLLHRLLHIDPRRRPTLVEVEEAIERLRRQGAPSRIIDADTIKNTVGELLKGRNKQRKRALAVGVTMMGSLAFLWFVGDHLHRWTQAVRFLTPMQHLGGSPDWVGGRSDAERAAMEQMAQLEPVKSKIARQKPRSATIAPFDYDTHEVTWQQVADWLNLMWFVHIEAEADSNLDRWVKDWRGRKLLDLDGDAPELLRVSGRFVPREGYAWRAADGISYQTAKAYCDYFGRRLPTEDEYEFAYHGDNDRWFPWGNQLPERTTDCALAVFDRDPDAAGRVAQCAKPGSRAVTGDVRDENKDVVNGVYGLMGNVSEWTSTPYRDPNDVELRGKSAHVLRGGNYLAPFALGISTMRQRFIDDEMRSGNGFRCAR